MLENVIRKVTLPLAFIAALATGSCTPKRHYYVGAAPTVPTVDLLNEILDDVCRKYSVNAHGFSCSQIECTRYESYNFYGNSGVTGYFPATRCANYVSREIRVNFLAINKLYTEGKNVVIDGQELRTSDTSEASALAHILKKKKQVF